MVHTYTLRKKAHQLRFLPSPTREVPDFQRPQLSEHSVMLNYFWNSFPRVVPTYPCRSLETDEGEGVAKVLIKNFNPIPRMQVNE